MSGFVCLNERQMVTAQQHGVCIKECGVEAKGLERVEEGVWGRNTKAHCAKRVMTDERRRGEEGQRGGARREIYTWAGGLVRRCIDKGIRINST